MIINFENKDITIYTDPEGQLWFMAKEICAILDIKNVSQALKPIDDADKMAVRRSIYTKNTVSDTGSPPMFVNESGLYTLIFKSIKPIAAKFQKWVTKAVLPQIRETGRYIPEGQKLPDPATLSKLDWIKLALEAEERISSLSEEIGKKNKRIETAIEYFRETKPAVEYLDHVKSFDNDISIKEFACHMNKNYLIDGKTLGQNRLFSYLREHKILMRKNGSHVPYAPYEKWFSVGYISIENENGVKQRPTIKLTGAGMAGLIKRLSKSTKMELINDSI